MSIVTIAPSHAKVQAPPKQLVSRDCGPDGCEIDWLASPRREADLDIANFTAFAMKKGWGDGLPMVPPTETRVRTFLSLNNRYPDEVIAVLPGNAECTVEKIIINAVMAGAPPESLPLLIAAVEAVGEPDFELYGVNATTASVAPALFVNGPIRDLLDIPYKHGCFGGAAGGAPAIGRALRLIMRNIAGQVVGVTSQSTFGSPARVGGIVVGEWEERSPWAPLAERRGVKGNAVTAFGAMGTMNIIDTTSQRPVEFLGNDREVAGLSRHQLLLASRTVLRGAGRTQPDLRRHRRPRNVQHRGCAGSSVAPRQRRGRSPRTSASRSDRGPGPHPLQRTGLYDARTQGRDRPGLRRHRRIARGGSA